MRRKALATVLTLTLTLSVAATAVQAGDAKPIQIALFSPVQIFKPDTAVHGLRLDLIYGANREMQGFDVGIASRTAGDFSGVQWTVVGIVDGKFTGWQNSYINISKTFEGVATGLYNGTDAAHGFQWGFINNTKSMRGFQLGFVNVTQKMNGLQIGLVNVIQDKKSLPVLPIVNWSF